MKMSKHSLLAAAIVAASLPTYQTQAADVKFSGFLNVTGEKHDAGDLRYLEIVENEFRFDRSDYGLNIASQLSDKISVAAQMIGGGLEGSAFVLDWAFLGYQLTDESRLKVGIMKNPNNLYSETVDVGIVYPWIHAPESVYSGRAELFFETYEGVGYSYTGGDDVEFSFEAYAGNLGAEDQDGVLEKHSELLGVALSASGEMGKIKLGYNTSVIESTDLELMQPIVSRNDKRYSVLSLGAEGEFGDFQVIAELSQSSLEDSPAQDRFGWYATLAYTFGDWKPHITYQDFSVDDNSVEQSSITFGLNNQISSSLVVKFELKRISDIIGNGFFDDDLRGVASIPNGGNATVIGVAVNAVF